MNIRVFDEIDDPFLKSEWERLEVETDVFPQSTYHWCATWWKHSSGPRKLHAVILLDAAGRAVGIAPLCIERHYGFRVLRSFPVNFGDFFHVVVSSKTNDEDVFDALFDYLKGYDRWNSVLLTPINDSSRLFGFLSGKGVSAKHLAGNIVADISSPTWDDFVATLSRNRRRLTRKKMRALESNHKVEIERITDEAGYAKHFDRIREIQKVRATKDRVDRSNSYMECIRETNARMFNKGRMVLYLVKADGTVISYRLAIISGKTYYDWNTNYDISWSEYSPGLIGIAYVIRDLISRGYTAVNFMAGVYNYKLSYSPNHEMRNNYLFVMGNRSLRAILFRKYQLEWRDRIRPFYQKVTSAIRRINNDRLEP